MSGICLNCGSQVTADYVRVMAPDDLADAGEVRACPRCAKVREGAEVRQARSAGNFEYGEASTKTDGGSA